VLVAFLGLIVNVVQVVAISNHAWLKATALSAGQPFTAHLSLTSVQFGNATVMGRDNAYFCPQGRGFGECSLSELCSKEVPPDTFANGMVKYTPQESWCKASEAGALATRLLFSGLLLGLAGTGITGMYAAQSIPWVALQFDKVEELGFSDEIQKYIILTCWGALWLFVFASMVTYAMMIPDSLGWDNVLLEASFGILRNAFVLCSLQVAIVVQATFELWETATISRFWHDFLDAECLSTKKALYIELALQLVLYFFMVVTKIDWSGLLIVLAFVYVAMNQRSFFALYLVLVTVSILFDIIQIAELPAFHTMTPGDRFGSILWLAVFCFKIIISGTLIAHEYLHHGESDSEGNAWTQFNDQGKPGPAYDEERYYDDERYDS